MWKRSNALSWPILIAREAWSYNLVTWVTKSSRCSEAAIKYTEFFTSSNLLKQGAKPHRTLQPPVMSGGHSELEPPLPISNRAVKRFCANDSALLVCESRSPPGSYKEETPVTEVAGVFCCQESSFEILDNHNMLWFVQIQKQLSRLIL